MRKKDGNKYLAGVVALSVMLLAGCSSSSGNVQTEPGKEQATDSSIAASTEAEAAKQEEGGTSSEAAQETDTGAMSLIPEAAAYFGATYGDFRKKGGEEAELLHGGIYVAKCPDIDAYAAFEGKWDDTALDYSLEDTSTLQRLEGNISTFFTGMTGELTKDEFVKQLEENYTVASEYRESGGTAYYVSAEDYLHLDLTSRNDNGANAVIEIACKENENIAPTSNCWVMGASETGNLFSKLPKDFVFTSGAGGWSTDIELSEDGSFVGQYHDSDMGDTGEGYPNGTVYVCSFSGKFSTPEPTDNQYIYSMKLQELKLDDEDKIGQEEIADDVLYVYTTPYGFDDADEFLLYMPGTPLSSLSDECRSWMFLSDSVFKEVPDGYFVIYNVGGEEAFTAQADDSIWYRRCIFDNGDTYVFFNPSYYMGSSLNFFTDDNSPATVGLDVPWDGKNTEPMECKDEWNDNSPLFSVTIEPADGMTSELLKYNISVECISDPQFDFSPWGSSEPGKFSALFTETSE